MAEQVCFVKYTMEPTRPVHYAWAGPAEDSNPTLNYKDFKEQFENNKIKN